MTKRKPKYEEMSDFEVNQCIARIVTDGDVIELDDMFPGPSEAAVQVIYKVGIHGEFVDYCNNPSDAWPIIVENKIDITSPASIGADDWQARKFYIQFSKDNIYSLDKNPLRAAMICFLRTKDAENENN